MKSYVAIKIKVYLCILNFEIVLLFLFNLWYIAKRWNEFDMFIEAIFIFDRFSIHFLFNFQRAKSADTYLNSFSSFILSIFDRFHSLELFHIVERELGVLVGSEIQFFLKLIEVSLSFGKFSLQGLNRKLSSFLSDC